jgi:copper(I)-binding protein
MIRPALFTAALLLATSAQASSYTVGALSAVEPWSRPAAAGTIGAGFLTLANGGPQADALVAIETPAAARVEIHQSSMAGGVSRMAKVGQVAVPAGSRVVFAPGGYHLMLMGLKTPLKPGQTFPATLTFASGRKLAVAFTVSDGMGPPKATRHH